MISDYLFEPHRVIVNIIMRPSPDLFRTFFGEIILNNALYVNIFKNFTKYYKYKAASKLVEECHKDVT